MSPANFQYKPLWLQLDFKDVPLTATKMPKLRTKCRYINLWKFCPILPFLAQNWPTILEGIFWVQKKIPLRIYSSFWYPKIADLPRFWLHLPAKWPNGMKLQSKLPGGLQNMFHCSYGSRCFLLLSVMKIFVTRKRFGAWNFCLFLHPYELLLKILEQSWS